MTIRQAGIDDLPELVRIGQQFLREVAEPYGLKNPNPVEMAAATANFMQNENAAVFVAEDQGKIVGTIGGFLAPVWFCSSMLVLKEQWWYVIRDRRGTIAAKRLLDRLEEWGSIHGAKVVAVSSIEALRGEQVGHFLERRGFKMTERYFVKGLSNASI